MKVFKTIYLLIILFALNITIIYAISDIIQSTNSLEKNQADSIFDLEINQEIDEKQETDTHLFYRQPLFIGSVFTVLIISLIVVFIQSYGELEKKVADRTKDLEKEIIERKKAEDEIKVTQKRMKVINSILRHDLTSDFTVIKYALSIYKRKSETKMLDEIESKVHKGLTTIKRLREQEFFIETHADLIKYEMKELLNEVISDFSGVEFNIEGMGTIYADRAIYSVFENLINNAIIHGNSKRIDIIVSNREQYCEIRFIDFGSGIPDNIKNKIFDEGFVHGEKGHTGIGLFNVMRIIREYGGKIRVEDNNPQGAVFVIRLRNTVKR